MEKIDVKKQLKPLYSAVANKCAVVDVPSMNFLMVDGQGDPNTSQDFIAAIEGLFTVSYSVKFMIKNGSQAIDYGVLPLEGLWWTDDPAAFNPTNKDIWKWTAMIMQPEWVTKALVETGKEETAKKKNLPVLSRMRFESFAEGKSAQVLHVGPYSGEAPTIERLHMFITDHGFRLAGKHHEIYLSDPGRSAPARLKTIIRQPIQ